ncbi:hypothetical protein BDQ17DRAFT_1331708 [Cyathus striatus]|nr:hypothetical protein BDQ17DRAFT_1331708 [Cyathus striatus]
MWAHYDEFGLTTMRFGGPKPQYMHTEPTEIKISFPMPLILGITYQLVSSNLHLVHVVTPQAASSGSLPGKDFKIAEHAKDVLHFLQFATMAGGVFWVLVFIDYSKLQNPHEPNIAPYGDDKSINSITTGLYMTHTQAQWIKNHNINSNGIVLDGREVYRGLSVLADVTGIVSGGIQNRMVNLVAAAVKSTAWQRNDGIITEGASPKKNNDGVGFKAVFIRGLLEAFLRSKSNTALQTLIRSYIDVQYNALIDLASNGDAYSSAWHGPAQNYTMWGQLAALDVLGSAIAAN